MQAVAVLTMRTRRIAPGVRRRHFRLQSEFETPDLGLVVAVARAADRPGGSSRAWYAAGWMAIESDRWAHDANGVARGLELAPETDQVVRPAVKR